MFMRSVKFNTSLDRQEGTPRLQLRGGFLDDAYFKRMPWSMGKSGHARLIVHDGQHAFCLRMFDSLQGLDPKVYFTPGKEGYLLFAARVGKEHKLLGAADPDSWTGHGRRQPALVRGGPPRQDRSARSTRRVRGPAGRCAARRQQVRRESRLRASTRGTPRVQRSRSRESPTGALSARWKPGLFWPKVTRSGIGVSEQTPTIKKAPIK